MDSPRSPDSTRSPGSFESPGSSQGDFPFEPFGAPPSPLTARDAEQLYLVNTENNTIQRLFLFPKLEYKYTKPEHIKFFKELPKKAGGGIFPPGEEKRYYITELMGTLFEEELKKVHEIFEDLFNKGTGTAARAAGGLGGSRRRRPSRKYKKSKRVLRRKSRSTRRR